MVGRLLLTDMPKRNALVGACPQGRYYGEAEAGASHVRRIQLMPDFIEIAENSCGASSDQFWTEMRRFESPAPATQWVSMHPFCLGLATTLARAALRLKAGRHW